jgi:hypothetical protein
MLKTIGRDHFLLILTSEKKNNKPIKQNGNDSIINESVFGVTVGYICDPKKATSLLASICYCSTTMH